MDGDIRPTPRELPALPASLAEFLAINLDERKIHVEPRKTDNTHLLTWLDRCRTIGIKFTVVPTELDAIITMRAESLHTASRVSSTDATGVDALENRDAALALLFRGASYRASDIHIQLHGSHTEVQFRMKGDCKVSTRLSQKEGESIIRAFYQGIAVVKDNSFNPLEVQNAQISGPVLRGSSLTSVRIARGPSYPVEENGGFMVLRLQYGVSTVGQVSHKDRIAMDLPRRPPGELRLESMGYSATQAARLRFLHEGSSGIVIFTGPTGSGKTTSIYEIMKELARIYPGKRQIAIEDPIEYLMPWAVQLVITNQSDPHAFGSYLRHALRMDPDKIFLGEIRDAEAALAAITAALTGHQVDTTMHVTDPYTVPDRIEIMDQRRLPRRMFCNSKIIRGIVNQRLVPRLCKHCSIKLFQKDAPKLDSRLMAALETYDALGSIDEVRLRGPGCADCSYDGIIDRVAVAEVIATDTALMRDFTEHGADVARQNFRAREGVDHSILHAAMVRVLAGEVDPQDIGSSVDVLVPYDQVDL